MRTAPVIFLAEDDPDDQEFFSEAVKTLDFEIQLLMSNNGETTIQQVTQTQPPPDFIFLDLNMPILNGLECLKILRQNESLKKTPIYIYTTYCSIKHKEEAYKLGVTSIFNKPYSVKDLSLLLRQVLEAKS